MPRANPNTRPNVPRVALTPAEAAAALGCSQEFFRENVDAELPWVRRGRKRFVGTAVLEQWIRDNSRVTL
jgi:hypothetical protein